MPLFDEATQSKECGKCHTVTTGGRPEVDKVYFKLQSTKDNYARVCKKCYYAKATPEEARDRNDKVVERKLTKMVEAEPIKDRPASSKAYTHSNADLRRIERSSGLKFVEWMDMGDCWMPRFGKAA